MNSSQQIIVSLSSFGASEVKRHGQAWFMALCHEAGADGAEVRGELLKGHENELSALAAVVRDTGLACVYSSPDMLCDAVGGFCWPALALGLANAKVLAPSQFKLSVGDSHTSSPHTHKA